MLYQPNHVDPNQTFRIDPLERTDVIFNVQPDTILQVSIQEPSTSFKPPSCDQKLILSQSLAELCLFSLHNDLNQQKN